MEQFRIEIRYDGIDATDHVIDMRLFGESLIGLERALSTGLNSLAHGQIVNSRSRPSLEIKATPPRPGSVEFDAVVEMAKGALPILGPLLVKEGAAIARLLIAAILKKNAGQKKQSEADVDRIVEIAKINAADRANERQFVQDLVDRLAPSAKSIVSPVGRSCEAISVSDGAETTEVDAPMAEAIRSKMPLEVSDMETVTIRFDELDRGKRKARVEIVSEPGRFVGAEIRDPSYDDFPNAYSSAFNEGRAIQVSAKLSRRREDGELVKLHIMDTA